MSNKRITDLTELTTPTTDDVFPVVDIATNTTTKVQLGNLPVPTSVTTALATKQDTLVSGTNIKTVNSTSLVGSGNVAVQETLVSGTNIKTINSTSLLGSGNITIAANPSGVAGAIQFSNGSAFASDAANLFWDDTNNRLGIGTNAPNSLLNVIGTGGISGIRVNTSGADSWMPFNDGNWYIRSSGTIINDNSSGGVSIGVNSPTTARLFVKGSGSTSATTSLLVQNSSGSEAFKITDDRNATFGGIIYTNGNILEGSTTGRFDIRAQYDLSFQAGRTGGSGSFSFGNTNSTPNASAIVDIVSTTKGFLPPRMTTTQKNAISSPAAGLVVYDSTTNKLCCYNGSTWNDLF